MTAENFDVALNALLDRRPFTVFTVELNGGDRFEIDSPRAVTLREGRAVFLAPGGIPVFFDHESVNKVFVAPAGADLRPSA